MYAWIPIMARNIFRRNIKVGGKSIMASNVYQNLSMKTNDENATRIVWI